MSETALVVVLPGAEATARHHTPDHVTVLRPYVASELVDDALLARLRTAFASVPPFTFRLGEKAAFARLAELASEVSPSGSVPHPTIKSAVESFASSVSLILIEPDGRWDVRDRFPLLGAWESLQPADLPALLGDEFGWAIAGGWAIDLFAGRTTRSHNDVDVEVAREDQQAVHRKLSGWELWCADPPGTLRPWLAGEDLPPGINDIFCRPSADSPWAMQLMLVDYPDGEWVFRHDSRVRRPLAQARLRSSSGLAVVAPELQLLFKSRHRYEKDEHDFAVALECMGPEQRAWLGEALDVIGSAPSWRERLR